MALEVSTRQAVRSQSIASSNPVSCTPGAVERAPQSDEDKHKKGALNGGKGGPARFEPKFGPVVLYYPPGAIEISHCIYWIVHQPAPPGVSQDFFATGFQFQVVNTDASENAAVTGLFLMCQETGLESNRVNNRSIIVARAGGVPRYHEWSNGRFTTREDSIHQEVTEAADYTVFLDTILPFEAGDQNANPAAGVILLRPDDRQLWSLRCFAYPNIAGTWRFDSEDRFPDPRSLDNFPG